MNRSMFLQRLRLGLYGLPEEEIESIVQSYDDFFKEAAENQLTEEEAVQELGNPKEIAEHILQKTETTEEKRHATSRTSGQQVLIVIGLILFNLCIMIGFIGSVFGMLFGAGIALLSCMIAPLLVLLKFLLVDGALLFELFFSIVLCGVSIIITPYFIKLCRFLFDALKRYIQWNVRVIDGERI